MERVSRDFLCLIGKEDAPPPPEQRPAGQQLRDEMAEAEKELSLGLSLGGVFSMDSKGKGKLPRSSSAAAVMTPPPVPVEVPAPPALLRASGSPSSTSSVVGDGQRLQGSGTLVRTSSLPAVSEAAGNDECNKLKEAQGLKRLDVKRKMIERRNSLTACSTSKEAAGGQVPQETSAHTGKSVSCDEAAVGNIENHSSGEHLAKRRRGRPPKYQLSTLRSQHSLSTVGNKPNSAFFKGISITEGQSSSSSVPSSSEAIRRVMAAASRLPPHSSLPPRTAAAALGSRGGDPTILGSSRAAAAAAAARANSNRVDVGRRLMQAMPAMYTSGLPNGNRIDGFLYKYKKAEDVRIVCICHGRFLTPSEFVEHAGAGKVDHPLRHITVNPTPTL